MRIILILFLAVFLSSSISFGYGGELLENISKTQDLFMSKQDQENFWDKKLTILKELGITHFGNTTGFGIDRTLRRDEAAKMLHIFSEYTNHNKENTHIKNDNCTFSDLKFAHSDLHDEIVLVCKKNIFKRNGGKFRPTDGMTNGEFIATVIRTIEGIYYDENMSYYGYELDHWALNYLNAATMNELLKNTIFVQQNNQYYQDKPVLRGDVAIVLANYIEKFHPDSCFHKECSRSDFTGPFEYQSYLAWVESVKNRQISTLTHDLIISQVSLDPEKPAPKYGDSVVYAHISFQNIGTEEIYLKKNTNQSLLECYDINSDVKKIRKMQILNDNTYPIKPGEVDGAYHISLSPSQMNRGRNTIICRIDPSNYIPESNEDNNLYPFSFYVN